MEQNEALPQPPPRKVQGFGNQRGLAVFLCLKKHQEEDYQNKNKETYDEGKKTTQENNSKTTH